MASKSSPWRSLGWWILLVISIPFIFYAAIYIRGDFEVYKKITVAWFQGKYDIAGLNILHHLRAWQIHATAAELFIITGLFQCSPSFRAKFQAIHRVLGYVFVAAGTVSSITGIFVLVPNTEFGLLAQVVFTMQGFALAYFLFVAVKMAKDKKFQVHQRYMIRAAATGYAVIAMRLFPSLFMALGLSFPVAMEAGAVVSPILFLGVAELYIQRVLLEPKVTTQYVQIPATKEPKLIESPKTDEVKELGTQDPQIQWAGEQTGLGSNRAGTLVRADIGQDGRTGGGSSGSKSVKLPRTSATWRGGQLYWRNWTRAPANQQCRIANRHVPRFSSKFDHQSPLCFPLDYKVLRATCQVAPIAMRFPNQNCQVLKPARVFSNTTFRVIKPTMGHTINLSSSQVTKQPCSLGADERCTISPHGMRFGFNIC